MTKFIATIELFGAIESDYEKLNIAMNQARFTVAKDSPFKKKETSQKKVEYSKEGNNLSIREVTNSVFKIASTLGRKYTFTIIKDKHIPINLQVYN